MRKPQLLLHRSNISHQASLNPLQVLDVVMVSGFGASNGDGKGGCGQSPARSARPGSRSPWCGGELCPGRAGPVQKWEPVS